MRGTFWFVLSFAVQQYLLPALGAVMIAILLGSVAGLAWYSIIGIAAASGLISWSGIQLVVQAEERLFGRLPLVANLESDTSQHLQFWWNVEVYNPNPAPVKQCYAKLASFRAVTITGEWRDVQHKMPMAQLKLMWRVSPGDKAKAYVVIGGYSKDVFSLSVACVDDNGTGTEFYTPQPAAAWTGGNIPMRARPLSLDFPLPAGTYEADLEIGSEEEALRITAMALQIVYEGDLRLEVKPRL